MTQVMSTDLRAPVQAGSDADPIEHRLRAAGLPPLRRLAWIEVDLAILEANARLLRGLLPPGTGLGIVVKAAGYGHGLVASARAALAGGAELLLVATLDEALALRAGGVHAPVLVLYPVPRAALDDAVEAGAEIVVADEQSLVDAISAGEAAARRPRAVRSGAASAGGAMFGAVGGGQLGVHLAVDTGMSRGGFPPERIVAAASRLARNPAIDLAGAWTHLASPEVPDGVARQVARFDDALERLRSAGHRPRAHLAATGGLFGTAPHYDLVRVGLAFYGLLPPELPVSPRAADVAARLRPALTLKARPVTVATIPAGAEVGYGGTWRAERDTTIATLPIGYGDGWTRQYAPGAFALVAGRRAPVVGRVSSDALAVDVTDVPTVAGAGSGEFVLLGEQGGERVEASELARRRESIVWEVLDALGDRLARVYVRGGRPVAVLMPGGTFHEAAPGARGDGR